ncbi:hypothetical protein VNO78_28689 [Psophocarpus tetragonolobus]|uniref:F-box domain-containing protein n=1 Tax=Psophocarpus tetragonolobus TaxID=3891 RepID=A0AAN9WYX1_PSOTE
MELQDLPEGCIAKILSYTTPVDAIRLSLTSKTFRSAAESDTVWDCFLLSDHLPSIIPPSSTSKKNLYFSLSDHPTIIDQGRKSVQLDKRSGKKCYMLSARNLAIIWGDNGNVWEWTSLPESRFKEVAVLRAVCWFDISGRINALALSANTHYAAFLVFKMINARGFHYHPVVLSIGVFGGNNNRKYVCLDPNLKGNRLQQLQCPKVRSDGWLEIEMGDFFNSGLEENQVQMKAVETTSHILKCGFILEGIEIRPKHVRGKNLYFSLRQSQYPIIIDQARKVINYCDVRFEEVARLRSVCWPKRKQSANESHGDNESYLWKHGFILEGFVEEVLRHIFY